MKIRLVGAEFFHAGGRTYRHSEERVVFRNFAKKRPINVCPCYMKLRRIIQNFDVATGCDVEDIPLICLPPPSLASKVITFFLLKSISWLSNYLYYNLMHTIIITQRQATKFYRGVMLYNFVFFDTDF
jgi:hypothetical protein